MAWLPLPELRARCTATPVPLRRLLIAPTPDRIYIAEVSGRTTVIANDASWTVLATNDLEGEVVASPAISNGDIVLRTRDHLLLVRDSLKSLATSN